MYKVFVPVLILMFTGVLAFIVANTALSFMFPIFDEIGSTGAVKAMGVFDQVDPIIKISVYSALYILVFIPVAYLLFRLLRKEQQPQQRRQQYYPGYSGG